MILPWFPKRPHHPLADTKELKRILAELHLEKAANAVAEVTGWFDSLKHAEDIRLDQCFEILRQLDEAAQPHLRNLARDYLHSPRLSKLEEQRLWTRSSAYLDEASRLYEQCIERIRLDPKSKGSEAFKPSLPLALVRLQAMRCTQVKWLAYRYGPIDDEIWKGLARTYLEADAAGQALKSVQLYPTQRGLSSVAQQYLHALIFCTSSIDSLVPLQIELADRLIAHFLPSFVFSAECRRDSVYWVDAAIGSAPARLARSPGVRRPGLRFFSPGSVPDALDELIHIVEHGDIPADLNLGGQYPQRVLLSVLRHLRGNWALRPPQRRHPRHATKTRMTVLQGFANSHALFANSNAPRDGGAESWVVDNVSLGGFRACFDYPPGDQPKLGTLLCLQPEGGDNWLLGAARRFNRLTGVRASLGVQLLSRQAQSIELRPRRSGSSAAATVPGIWMRDGEPGLIRILLPPGEFNVRESLEFSAHGRVHVLTPLELEESSCDYEVGRFHDESAA